MKTFSQLNNLVKSHILKIHFYFQIDRFSLLQENSFNNSLLSFR